jgi:mannitol-1-phosphate 5-dehydrogenase
MTGKKGVHFGAGNIGRGLVARLLHNSGFEIVFLDVIDNLIETFQKTASYEIIETGEQGEKNFVFDNYRALNVKHSMNQVVHEIATADTVTCAVGPQALESIAEPIAKGIEARIQSTTLAVIAYENEIGATDILRGFVETRFSAETKINIAPKVCFANSTVDRIVPVQPKSSGLDILTEEFYEWCVEKKPFDGSPPQIKGVNFVEDLQPYIERKLFTVSTSHATAAYYSHNRNFKYIHDVLADKKLHDIVLSTLKETARIICTKHLHISREDQDRYVQTMVKRVSEPSLKDTMERVGRDPLHKLGRHERFIGPAALLVESGMEDDYLLGGIKMALRFQDINGDEESAELVKKLENVDTVTATKEHTGLEEDHPLLSAVSEKVKKVQGVSM